MAPHLIQAHYLGGYRIQLMYEDGTRGVIDLEADLWGEVFEPLKDLGRFQEFRVDPELGTIVWPNGADFAPEFLYQRATA